jgi:hypothetical protein
MSQREGYGTQTVMGYAGNHILLSACLVTAWGDAVVQLVFDGRDAPLEPRQLMVQVGQSSEHIRMEWV